MFDFVVPPSAESIRFDIGLSYCAPNSAVWLKENKNVFVVGVEPNRFCIDSIKKNGLSCKQKGVFLPYPQENFVLIECAIDDISEPTEKVFYHMRRDPGTSSLLRPTKKLKDKVKEEYFVFVIPFSYLLAKVPWSRFDYIELVKTDTQGKDLDVIKSAGAYLQKIVYLNSEINTFNHYHNNPSPEEFDSFITCNGFVKLFDNAVVKGAVVDRTYINKQYIHLKDDINYFVL